MDAVAQVVKDVIDLKLEADNIPSNATIEKMFNWYSWSLENGILEVVYKYGVLQGYMEWVRTTSIPKNREDVENVVDYTTIGPYLYITNCCIRDDGTRHGIMWKLIHTIREKNKEFECVCWHDTKGILHVYENTKQE